MTKNKYEVQCSKCGKLYEVECSEKSFLQGKYRKTCSAKCANSRPMTEEKRKKISEGVKRTIKPKIYHYTCEICGNSFTKEHPFKKGRHIHCEKCIQNRPHFLKDPDSILDVSKRTISKILKRSNQKCSICGWNESTCDIHHIIPKKYKGDDSTDNLIIVCPNCHRVIHTTNKYSIEFLKTLSISKIFSNWQDFYHKER